MGKRSPARPSKWRLSIGDLGRFAVGLVASTLGLQLADWLLPRFDVGGWERAFVAALLIAMLSALLRPVLVALATRLGWVGALLLAVFGQAFIIWLTFWDPGVGGVSILSAVVAAWIVAFVSTGAVWVVTAGTDEAVTASLIRKAGRRKRDAAARRRCPRRGVRAGRRRAVPGPRVGRQGRHPADAVALGAQRLAPDGRVAAPAARDHAGQPDGHPARHQ